MEDGLYPLMIETGVVRGYSTFQLLETTETGLRMPRKAS